MSSISPGDSVRVFISNRHDFIRFATIITIKGDQAIVRYDNGEVEEIPLRWIE